MTLARRFKKQLSLILALLLILSLSACAGEKDSADPSAGGPAGTPRTTGEENTGTTEAARPAPETAGEPEDSTGAASEESSRDPASGSHILVAFFSRTGENHSVGVIEKGNTHIIADMIAERTGADLFEIVTVEPYPDTYDECTDVAKQEQKDNARPEIVDPPEDLDGYDTIFIGYPIWWGDLPMAVYTFLERYDLTGKTVIPFCTHEGSGLAGTKSSIEKTCSGATVLDGLAIRGSTAQNEQEEAKASVEEWLEELGMGTEAGNGPVFGTNEGGRTAGESEGGQSAGESEGGRTAGESEGGQVAGESGGAPVVYFTSDISADGMLRVYEALGWEPVGKTAVKLSTGEPPESNYLRPELIKEVVDAVDGTIVECNTAYGGSRSETAMHYQVAADHGFTAIADFQILDEDGSMTLPVEGGSVLTENYVGAAFDDYDSYLVLSHFKGHAMAGYGGAIKNISIGLASSEGKGWIHSGGTSRTNIWGGEQDAFLEAMAEAGRSVSDHLGNGERIAYINVMNRLSIDCDCDGSPAEPDMHDIGILASTDCVALDEACIDLVYEQKDGDGASLVRRIESRNGLHTLEHAEEIGLGSRAYTLENIDD